MHELMPNIHIPRMGQTGVGGEHWRSQNNPPRTPRQGIRIGTLRPNDPVPETTNLRENYDKRPRKAPMYKEKAKSTHSRALCVPSPCKNETEKEAFKASDIKRLIEEVLEQKQVVMMLREIPTKGFPLSEELQRQPVQPGFKLPQLSVYLGKEDPVKHVQHFVAMTVLHGWDEVTRCRAFLLSLAGQAQQWFTDLPAGHIRSFD